MTARQQGPKLPQGFIFIAFLNFTVGAVLGAVMAVDPAEMPVLAGIHAILNPYGWLTVLIYGMTFAVLALSLGVRLPTLWQGWLQLVVAEGGVVLVAVGASASLDWIRRIGVILLVLAPVLFLYNILSGVRYTRKIAGAAQQVQSDAGRLFGRFAAYRATDAVGQRGTDLSLMIFIVAAVWAAIEDWGAASGAGLATTSRLEWLTFYGWIGGTTLSVALHLAPRFLGRKVEPAWLWSMLQVAWFGGVLLAELGSVFGVSWNRIGSVLVGGALFVTALRYIQLSLVRGKHQDDAGATSRVIGGPGLVAWFTAWGFAVVFGGVLVVNGQPFALSSIHFLFLGFITSLVYAVGYTAFPIVLGRSAPQPWLGYVQIACAIIGAASLIYAFVLFGNGVVNRLLLGAGGVFAVVGVLGFLAMWAIPSRRRAL